MILQLGNAGHANAALMADSLRGGFKDKLNEGGLINDIQGRQDLKEYRDMSLALTNQAQYLDAVKTQLNAQLATAKNAAEVERLTQAARKLEQDSTRISLMSRELESKLGAIGRMGEAGNDPSKVNFGDMAAVGFRPPIPTAKDSMDADNYARSLLYEQDSDGRSTGRVRQNMTQSELTSISRALEHSGQALGQIDLQPVEYQNWRGKTVTAPARSLYFISPKEGLGKMGPEQLKQFLNQLREAHDIDEDDPVWAKNVEKFLE
jgi:hypothetical protein